MTAVDDNHGAGHITRGIGCQQKQWPVEVFRAAEPPLRDALDHVLTGLGFPELSIQIRIYISGRKGIHLDAVTRAFKRQCLCHLDNACLRNGVGDHGTGLAKAEDRGNVDNAATALHFTHRAAGCLRHQEHAREVGVDNGVSVLFGLIQGRGVAYNARVVNEDIYVLKYVLS